MKQMMACALALLALTLAGCSRYRVQHTETGADGIIYSTIIDETVPPGGKKLSDGMADIGVNVAGDWHMKLGAQVDTDATGTATLLENAVTAAVKAAVTAALAQQAAGAVAPAVEAAQ